jgi:Multiubiquitin
MYDNLPHNQERTDEELRELAEDIRIEGKEIHELEEVVDHEKEKLHHLEERLEHELEHEPVTVKVNNLPVIFLKRTVTGLTIKETAIAQKVAIQPDFNLFEKKEEEMKPIKDTQLVHLKEGDEFRAVAPDDNSFA